MRWVMDNSGTCGVGSTRQECESDVSVMSNPLQCANQISSFEILYDKLAWTKRESRERTYLALMCPLILQLIQHVDVAKWI